MSLEREFDKIPTETKRDKPVKLQRTDYSNVVFPPPPTSQSIAIFFFLLQFVHSCIILYNFLTSWAFILVLSRISFFFS